MIKLTCPCGKPYTRIPDEDTTGVPPSFMARQYICNDCGDVAWLEPYDAGLFCWEDEELAYSAYTDIDSLSAEDPDEASVD